MSFSLVTPPAIEPVTLAEAKKQLEIGISDTSHDSHVTRLIKAAREDVERLTRRALITQTWQRNLSSFPSGRIFLPRPPLRSVTITYRDGNGALQPLTSSHYQIDTDAAPGSIEPAINEQWPVTEPLRRDAVLIEFSAGYGSAASDVPEVFRQVILELVAFRFWFRGDMNLEIPKHIKWSLSSLRCGAHSGYYDLKT
jgi:uncharacterized phiE125 gp8 family phage protein